MTLIGCVCTYNEAPHVQGAIESLFAVGCDRVVVVDGQWQGFAPDEHYASTDGTQDIARQAGAEVIEAQGGAWPTQVDARNAYLVGEPGDWYLVCDADERCRGTLPPLSDDVNRYWVEMRGNVGSGPLSPGRLFRHSGKTFCYYQRHYLLYADGEILETPSATADEFYIEGFDRQDLDRDQRKAEFYPVQAIAESGGDPNRRHPFLRRIPPEILGTLTYIGGGAWLGGVPARNLTANEANTFYWHLIENLRGPRPIYQQQQQVKLMQDDQDDQVTQDQQQQQSEPADNLAEPTQKRTQRRKEK